MAVAISISFAMLFFLFIWGRNNFTNNTTFFLAGGWMIKALATWLFFYVYAHIYGNGELVEDAGAYIKEAKILNSIYRTNKADYFSVLFNKQGSEETIVSYFEDVKNSRIGPKSAFVNDTRNQIKFISIVTLIIGENVFGILAFFAMLSFLGLLVLWKSLKEKTSSNPNFTFLLLLLPISLLFWTSSPLKECTTILGLQLLIAGLIRYTSRSKWILLVSFGMLFTLLFKPHLLFILIISYVLVYIFRKTIINKKWSYGLTFLALVIGVFYFNIPKKALVTLSDQQFDFVNVARGGVHMEGDSCYYFLEKKNRAKIKVVDSLVEILAPVEMIAIQKGKIRHERKFIIQPNSETFRFEYEQFGGSSYFKTRSINRSWTNLALGLPEAFINGSLRPFLWTNFLSLKNIVFFLENLFFLILAVIAIRNRKGKTEQIRILTAVFLITSLIFILIIGYTTPISGAIVRYRIPVQLFILVSFIFTTKKYEFEQ